MISPRRDGNLLLQRFERREETTSARATPSRMRDRPGPGTFSRRRCKGSHDDTRGENGRIRAPRGGGGGGVWCWLVGGGGGGADTRGGHPRKTGGGNQPSKQQPKESCSSRPLIRTTGRRRRPQTERVQKKRKKRKRGLNGRGHLTFSRNVERATSRRGA